MEVGKYSRDYCEGSEGRNKERIMSWINKCLGSMGNCKYGGYFGGGMK